MKNSSIYHKEKQCMAYLVTGISLHCGVSSYPWGNIGVHRVDLSTRIYVSKHSVKSVFRKQVFQAGYSLKNRELFTGGKKATKRHPDVLLRLDKLGVGIQNI